MNLSLLSLTLLICFSCVSGGGVEGDVKNRIEGNDKISKQIQVNWIGMWMFRKSKKELEYAAAREFEFLNQDIRINIKMQEELCNGCKDPRLNTEDTILNMIHTGKVTWDIIVMTQKNYADIAKALNDPEWGAKYLVNFDEYSWFHESHKPIIFEVSQFKDDMGGIFCGPVIEGRYYSMWYNKKTADKLGIKVKSLGMTFNDFKNYLETAYKYNKLSNNSGKVNLFAISNQSSIVEDVLNSLILSELGGDENTPVNMDKSLSVLKKSLKAMEEISRYNLLDTSIQSDSKEPVLDGQALFGVYPSSIINQWQDVNMSSAVNMVPTELPVFEKTGRYYHGTYQSVWAVMKNAPHREEAIKFLQFLCSNDIAERWLSTTKNPTALNVRINASDLGKDDVEIFNREIEIKYGNKMRNFNISEVLFGTGNKNVKIDAINIIKRKQTAEECYLQIVQHLKKNR